MRILSVCFAPACGSRWACSLLASRMSLCQLKYFWIRRKPGKINGSFLIQERPSHQLAKWSTSGLFFTWQGCNHEFSGEDKRTMVSVSGVFTFALFVLRFWWNNTYPVRSRGKVKKGREMRATGERGENYRWWPCDLTISNLQKMFNHILAFNQKMQKSLHYSKNQPPCCTRTPNTCTIPSQKWSDFISRRRRAPQRQSWAWLGLRKDIHELPDISNEPDKTKLVKLWVENSLGVQEQMVSHLDSDLWCRTEAAPVKLVWFLSTSLVKGVFGL